MPAQTYEPTDRRPLASRERVVWQKLANSLASNHVSPNSISIVSMVFGIAAGAMLVGTAFASAGWHQRGLWLAAAAAIQLRLLANMLDGMVAIASQQASPLGELYNELPDRVSDVAIIIGAGYAAGGLPSWGFLAAVVAVLTAYIRAVGKAMGASNLFLGPMAKPHRMFTLTLVAVFMGVLPAGWQPFWGASRAGLVSVGLGCIILGGLVTVFRRLRSITRHLRAPG